MRARKSALMVGLLALAAAAGCANQPKPPPQSMVAIDRGTILAARTLPAGGEPADFRLVAVALAVPVAGATDAAAAQAVASPAVEFILRQSGGRIISVVQPNPEALRVGETVAVLHDQRTRLSRLP